MAAAAAEEEEEDVVDDWLLFHHPGLDALVVGACIRRLAVAGEYQLGSQLQLQLSGLCCWQKQTSVSGRHLFQLTRTLLASV